MKEIDAAHIWHPYETPEVMSPPYIVDSAEGAVLHLSDGTEMIDGISSWWCKNHGYSHPMLIRAMKRQIEQVSHVMFGGLTHKPAIELAKELLRILPSNLKWVLYTDSGSGAIEVSIKIARQYWQQRNKSRKTKMAALLHGYHGDTTGAAMISSTSGKPPKMSDINAPYFLQLSAEGVSSSARKSEVEAIEVCFQQHSEEIAAFFVEPIFQGAGGIRFYSAEALFQIYMLCKKYNILLVADEVASGFGRTGKLFACEHANILPDILCLGKALTGGMINLAVVVCSDEIAKGACANGEPLSYGPTFMANPLACATAIASIKIFKTAEWENQVSRIEQKLKEGLSSFQALRGVRETRVLGAIGAVEMNKVVDCQKLFPMWKKEGVWLRPFGNIIYTMPPYIVTDEELDKILHAMKKAVKHV